MGHFEAIVATVGFATAEVASHGEPRFSVADSRSPKIDADRSYGYCCYWSNLYLCAGTTLNDCCCHSLGCNEIPDDGGRVGSILTSPRWCSSLTPTYSANKTVYCVTNLTFYYILMNNADSTASRCACTRNYIRPSWQCIQDEEFFCVESWEYA